MDSVASDVAHLLRRAGFGARPDEIEAAATAGYEATVDSLIAGTGSAPDPTGDQVTVPTFAPYQRPTAGPKGSPAQRQARKAQAKVARTELAPLQEWWLDRMIVTSTPLREKLTLLWHGHFATAVSKVRDPKLMYLQNQIFRTEGAGSFAALTQSVAKSGAMMIWLDTGTDKAAHPNENFARECMELFTLGVGNYSQADVVAAARCFTGWTYDRSTDTWRVQARQHDNGVKTLLGTTGDLSGEDAINVMVGRPASARFVTSKLWSLLAYPVTPTDPVVGDLLGAYGPGYDVAALLRAIFLHPAFRSPTARGGLVKQPVEYLAGAARALGLDARGQRLGPDGLPVPSSATGSHRTSSVTAATALAQTPFDPPSVGGWPENGYWLNTATALARMRTAEALARAADLSTIAGASSSQRPAAVAQMLGLADGWTPATTSALAGVASDPATLVATALNSPDYVLN